MVLEMLGTEAGSVLLLVLLIAAFVVAFKIMQMVFETVLVSAISAGFYVSLVYFFGYTFTVERVLLFAFLGATLYMGYSFLASMYSIVSKLIEVPYHILKTLLSIPVAAGKKSYGYLRKKHKIRKLRDSEKRAEHDQGRKGGDDSEDVKDVVLDKVRKEEDKED